MIPRPGVLGGRSLRGRGARGAARPRDRGRPAARPGRRHEAVGLIAVYRPCWPRRAPDPDAVLAAGIVALRADAADDPRRAEDVRRRAQGGGLAGRGPIGPPTSGSRSPRRAPQPSAPRASAPASRTRSPAWLAGLTHPAIVLAGIPLGLLFWRRRRRCGARTRSACWRCILLLRCVLDPWNNDYYHAPFLLALLAWEALARDGWPRLTVLAGAPLALTFPRDADLHRARSVGRAAALLRDLPGAGRCRSPAGSRSRSTRRLRAAALRRGRGGADSAARGRAANVARA